MDCEKRRVELEEQPTVMLYSIVYKFLEEHPEIGQPTPDKLAKSREDLIEYILSLECGAEGATSSDEAAPPPPPPPEKPTGPTKNSAGEYVCPVCGKSFKNQAWLTRHIKQFHPELENAESAASAPPHPEETPPPQPEAAPPIPPGRKPVRVPSYSSESTPEETPAPPPVMAEPSGENIEEDLVGLLKRQVELLEDIRFMLSLQVKKHLIHFLSPGEEEKLKEIIGIKGGGAM